MYQSVIRDCVSQINQENVVCPHFLLNTGHAGDARKNALRYQVVT
jgi:hypothetical protein